MQSVVVLFYQFILTFDTIIYHHPYILICHIIPFHVCCMFVISIKRSIPSHPYFSKSRIRHLLVTSHQMQVIPLATVGYCTDSHNYLKLYIFSKSHVRSPYSVKSHICFLGRYLHVVHSIHIKSGLKLKF